MSNQATIRKQLLERKAQLEEELKRLVKEKVSDDQVQDPGDQASNSVLEELNISLQHNEWAEYRRVLKALEMLDQGTYGICSECGQQIAERRLSLYPNATRCITCQEAFEERG